MSVPRSHVHIYASRFYVQLITLRIDSHDSRPGYVRNTPGSNLVPADVVGTGDFPLPDPAGTVLAQQRRRLVQVDLEDALDVARQLVTLIRVSWGRWSGGFAA